MNPRNLVRAGYTALLSILMLAPVCRAQNITTVVPASAGIRTPSGIAVDSSGTLYVTEAVLLGGTVRKVTASGSVSTLATGFVYPLGISLAPDGSLLVADREASEVKKVSSAGTVSVFAGTGTKNYGGDGGPAASAELNTPSDVFVDSAYNVYIADTGHHLIRKVSSSGILTTVAGGPLGNSKGLNANDVAGVPALSALFYQPYGVALDGNGNLYIGDWYNYRIRKLSGSTVTTIAGSGNTYPSSGTSSGDGGPALQAHLQGPTAVAVDKLGNVYFSDTPAHCVRKIDTTGNISRFAGICGTPGYAGDSGPAQSATLNTPTGLTFDSSGNLLIADSGNNAIRKVTISSGSAAPGTVVYYRFEDKSPGSLASGGGSVVDTAGSGQNGSPSGSLNYSSDVPVSSVAGQANTASMQFTASGSITFFGQFPLNTLANATMEFWIKPTGSGGEMDFLWTRGDSSDTNRFNMGVTGSTIFLDYRDPGGVQHVLTPSGNIPITTNVWNHIAVVKSGNLWTSYVNGVQKGQVTDNNPNLPTNTGWTMNGRGFNAFTGFLDEFRISNSTLAPSQFLYTGGGGSGGTGNWVATGGIGNCAANPVQVTFTGFDSRSGPVHDGGQRLYCCLLGARLRRQPELVRVLFHALRVLHEWTEPGHDLHVQCQQRYRWLNPGPDARMG